MLSGLAGHNDANSIKNYMKGTAKFLKAMSLFLSRKMGQNQRGGLRRWFTTLKKLNKRKELKEWVI